MSDAETLLDPVLAELELDVEGTHVVAIGGGHGLAVALQALLDYAGRITAIVSVADDGGSSGRLSPALEIPPMGDIRRALLALSPEPSLWRRLMEFRFDESDVAGHSLGNLLIAAMTEMAGDFEDALHTAGRLLGAKGAVVPAAAQPLTLRARVGGAWVEGQVAIATGRGPIESIEVAPAHAKATRAAVDALADADQIVLGPGSLFTSVIAGLCVPGIAEAVNDSGAELVYICNLTTQDGETLGLTGEQHVAALSDVGGIRPPDAVVVNEGPIAVPPGLEAVRIEDGSLRIVGGDLAAAETDWPAHDPARLGAVLRRLA